MTPGYVYRTYVHARSWEQMGEAERDRIWDRLTRAAAMDARTTTKRVEIQYSPDIRCIELHTRDE